MTSRVQINNVSHQFGSFTALDNINLNIEAGSFSVLLGPSGCGKTTLLSVLGGFLNPTSGSVYLDNADVTHIAPAQRETTTMFQDYALFPHLTLLDNVAFGLRMRKQSKRERHKKAMEMLALVSLESESRKKPHELSGGQRQRVALARALAVDPAVLLLDEPLGALDLKLRRQMQDELKAIQKRVGTTFVHVTHDQEEAMAIADNIVVMNAGRIVDQGTPENIYLKPKASFSASFMGEANLLKGTVKQSDERQLSIETSLGTIHLDADANINGNINENDLVEVCFRPEHVQLDAIDLNNVLTLGECRVVDHAFFGTHQRCQLRASNNETYIANIAQTQAVEIGQTFALAISKQATVVLSANT